MNDYNNYGNDTTLKALLDIGPWILGGGGVLLGVLLLLVWIFS